MACLSFCLHVTQYQFFFSLLRRVDFYVTTFESLARLEEKFHGEMGKVSTSLTITLFISLCQML